jgi:transcriptional regulator with GAF, ATPase, and Fis domain
MVNTREQRLVETFVALTDTLVDDYDVVELLQTLVDKTAELFDVAAAGILLANQRQELEVVASTSERSALIGLLQLDVGEGPCVEAHLTGRAIAVEDPADMARRWPRFAAASVASGYASVLSLPLRLRGSTLGSMNLFRDTVGTLNDEDAVAARALTDVATISILQQQTLQQATLAQAQLQQALDSRVLIEQAKGFVAQVHGVDMDTAFRTLRDHARSHRMPLAAVARGVVERTITI